MRFLEALANVRREGAPASGCFLIMCLALSGFGGACGRPSAAEIDLYEGPVTLLREDELVKAVEEDPVMQQFIADLEGAIAVGDRAFLREALDEEAMMQLVMEGTPDTERLVPIREGFTKGTLSAWKTACPLEQFVGAHYRFLRVRIVAGRAGLVFRMSENDDDLHYHLHQIKRDADGSYRVADTYIVGLSESIADTLRRGFLHLAADAAPATATIADAETSRIFVENLEGIGSLSEALANRRYAEALDIYHALPKEVQGIRDVVIMRVEAAARVSPLMLDEALDLWKELYEDESLLALKFIDYHMARGNYARARELAWDVELMTGGDPYLRVRIGELSFAVRNQMPAVKLSESNGRGRRGQARGR